MKLFDVVNFVGIGIFYVIGVGSKVLIVYYSLFNEQAVAVGFVDDFGVVVSYIVFCQVNIFFFNQ